MSGCPEYADLMGGYVLGSLAPAEREEMERHLQTCEACRREYEALSGLPSLLDRIEPADVPPPLPSDSLEDAVLDQVARERGRRNRRLAGLRRPPRVALFGAAAALLAVLLVTALLVFADEDDAAYAFGDLRGTPGAEGSFVLNSVPAGTRVNVEVSGLPARKDYELWCVRTDGRWVSGGTFRAPAGGRAEAQLTAAVRPGEYHRVVITGRGATRPDYEPQFLRGKLQY